MSTVYVILWFNHLSSSVIKILLLPATVFNLEILEVCILNHRVSNLSNS